MIKLSGPPPYLAIPMKSWVFVHDMFARRRRRRENRAWDGKFVELYGLQNTFLIAAAVSW